MYKLLDGKKGNAFLSAVKNQNLKLLFDLSNIWCVMTALLIE